MSDFTRVSYTDGGIELSGLHARPEGAARAAVAVFPTFLNTTPGVEAKAQALVDEGCAVFIGDYYGPDAPSNPDEAFGAMKRLRADPAAMRTRLRATIVKLRELEPDLPQLAMGFCLGGMAVLEMARDGQYLRAVASFHGLLETGVSADKTIIPRILVCHGDADSLVPREQVVGFWDEMDSVKADWHFHSYAGIEHGFTTQRTFDGSPNPAYDASADRQSWSAMLGIFNEVLGQ